MAVLPTLPRTFWNRRGQWCRNAASQASSGAIRQESRSVASTTARTADRKRSGSAILVGWPVAAPTGIPDAMSVSHASSTRCIVSACLLNWTDVALMKSSGLLPTAWMALIQKAREEGLPIDRPRVLAGLESLPADQDGDLRERRSALKAALT